MKVRISSTLIFKAGIYFCLIWDTLLLSMFNLQFAGRRYSVMFMLALLFAGLVLTNRNRRRLTWESLRYPKIYVCLVCGMLLVHMLYAILLKRVSFSAFAHNAMYYLMCLWAFPLIYLFKKEGTEKFWKTVNLIMVVWYSWLLIEYIAYQSAGIVLSPAISESTGGVHIRNGAIRLEMKALAHIAIIYNFDRFYNQADRKHRLWNLAMALYGMLIMVIVEQTRGYYIAVFGAIAVLILCYNKKAMKLLVSGAILLIAAFVIFRTRMLSRFLTTLFDKVTSGETGATGLIRIQGMTAFWKQFLSNPLFGFGFQETGDFITTARGVFYFNDNGFLGIVGQIGIWAFVIYGCMVWRFGYIVRKLFKAKEFRNGTLLLGLYAYMLLTSISLICYWNTTCLLCPLLWALFEVGYSQWRAKEASPSNG